MNLKSIVDHLISRLPEMPQVAVILGTGLSTFVDSMDERVAISYTNIPGFPRSTVSGHIGEWVFGYISGSPVICANGRFHIYEGYTMEEVTLPIRTIHTLGCKRLIITNSSGCLKLDWSIGDLMIIRGYIDYTFSQKKGISEIVNIEIDKQKMDHICSAASELGFQLREGIYTWTLGPSYETPAEIQDIISLGGNAVGMSTVPEIMKAMELGLDITGIACFTNYGAGIKTKKLSHVDVLEASNKMSNKLSDLVNRVVAMNIS